MSRSRSEKEVTPLKQHHVVPNPSGGWDIKTADAQRASAHYPTKESAVAAARTISQNQRSELFIHNKDGKIASRDSHGNDPFPPRG